MLSPGRTIRVALRAKGYAVKCDPEGDTQMKDKKESQ